MPVISVSISEELCKALERLEKITGRSRSELVRDALTRYLREQGVLGEEHG